MRTTDHPTNAPRSPAPSGVAGDHLTRVTASRRDGGRVGVRAGGGSTVAYHDATSFTSSLGA